MGMITRETISKLLLAMCLFAVGCSTDSQEPGSEASVLDTASGPDGEQTDLGSPNSDADLADSEDIVADDRTPDDTDSDTGVDEGDGQEEDEEMTAIDGGETTDCAAEICRPPLELGQECGPDDLCRLGNCSNGHCAPEGFSYIPAGTFCMGSPGGGGSVECPDGEEELGHVSDESPLHQVTLTRAFFLQQTEVTQAQWLELFDINPSRFDDCGETCPVEDLTWYEAAAYLNALSEAEDLEPCYTLIACNETAIGEGMKCTQRPEVPDGDVYDCAGYRFPTEAEWEYAYRAGSTTAIYNGDLTYSEGTPLDPLLDQIAWYGANSEVTYSSGTGCEFGQPNPKCGPHPVGEKLPNDWGLFDMAGNVEEWVWDSHALYSSDAVLDPVGNDPGPVWWTTPVRGGSWYSKPVSCRAANRPTFEFSHGVDKVGFRVARTVPTD